MEEQSCWLRTSVEGQSLTVKGGGDWTVQNLACLDRLLGGLNFDNLSHVFMDVSGITTLDTAGAHIIHRTMNKLDRGGIAAVLSGLDVAYRPLLEIVTEANGQPHEPLREQSHFILEMLCIVVDEHITLSTRSKIIIIYYYIIYNIYYIIYLIS